MNDRRHARTLAMQCLCQAEVLRETFLEQLVEFLRDESPPAAVERYAKTLATESWEHLDQIDQNLQAAAENWKVARMAPVDRNILRVAMCELLHHPETPPHAVIDEAVEIGKLFGTAESGAFINGVLDAAYKSLASVGMESQPATASPSGPQTTNH